CQKLHRIVLEKIQQTVITGRTRVILGRGECDLTQPHEPRAHAQAVVANCDAQVVRQGVVASLIVMKVLAGGRSDRRRSVCGRPTSKNERSGSALTLASHHQQALGECLEGYLTVLSPRVWEPEHCSIQDGRRENVRVLGAECVQNSPIVAYENGIVRWDVSQPLRLGEIYRKGISRGYVVVVTEQTEIFFHLPRGIAVGVCKTGRQAFRVEY